MHIPVNIYLNCYHHLKLIYRHISLKINALISDIKLKITLKILYLIVNIQKRLINIIFIIIMEPHKRTN